MKDITETTQKTTTLDITCFTPSVGVTSTKLCFIQLFTTKTTVLICALSCRSLQSSRPRTQQQASVHITADLPFHPQNPSAHTAAEVVPHTAGT